MSSTGQSIFFAPLRVPVTDPNTGLMSRPWYLFLEAMFRRVGGSTGVSNDDLEQLVNEDLDIAGIDQVSIVRSIADAQALSLLSESDPPSSDATDALMLLLDTQDSSTGGANPTAKVGPTAVNGSAATFMRSDGAPPIDLAATYAWTGAHAMSGNPMTALLTRPETGVAAFKSAATTAANNTLTSDASLTVTFNEIGWYAFEIFLPFFEATSGVGGFAFNVLNGGTYGLGVLRAAVFGFNTAAIANTAAITSPSTTVSSATISTGSSVPSWYWVKGVLQVTSAGTAAVQWAQNATNVNVTTLMAGAYVLATKIG